jgi:hypothetical protein
MSITFIEKGIKDLQISQLILKNIKLGKELGFL